MSNKVQGGLNLLIYPSALSGSGRLNKISRSLQSSGLFSETHIVGIKSNEALLGEEEIAQNVKIVRLPGASMNHVLGAFRIILLWPFRVYFHYRRKNLSAVAAQNVYLLPLAYHLSRKTGAMLAYNAHELETETIGAKGLKKKIAQLIEQRYIYRAQVVSVVNEPIAEWYTKKYPGITPIILTNTPVDDGGKVNLKKALGIPSNELLYIHVGHLMQGRSIPLILDTFSEIPNIHIAFLGSGYLLPEVEKASQKYSNIHLLPLVAPEQVVSVVRGADAGICLIEPVSLSDKLSTPNKLMECLAAGVPPLSSNIIEAKNRLGPEYSKVWIIDNPQEQLTSALRKINIDQIVKFKNEWKGIQNWDDQAKNLVVAYQKESKDFFNGFK